MFPIRLLGFATLPMRRPRHSLLTLFYGHALWRVTSLNYLATAFPRVYSSKNLKIYYERPLILTNPSYEASYGVAPV